MTVHVAIDMAISRMATRLLTRSPWDQMACREKLVFMLLLKDKVDGNVDPHFFRDARLLARHESPIQDGLQRSLVQSLKPAGTLDHGLRGMSININLHRQQDSAFFTQPPADSGVGRVGIVKVGGVGDGHGDVTITRR